MKLNLSQPLIDHKGFPVFEPVAEGKQLLITLGLALERAAVFGGKPDDSGPAKYAQYQLAKLMSQGGELELPSDALELAKELASRVFNAVGYGAIVDAIEGKSPQIDLSLLTPPPVAELPTQDQTGVAAAGDIADLLDTAAETPLAGATLPGSVNTAESLPPLPLEPPAQG